MNALIASRLRGLILFATMLAGFCVVAQTGVKTYNIPLFREEQALTDPINTRAYWFEMRPGVVLNGNPVVHVVYVYSQTILPNQGTIAVFCNGVPLASRGLSGAAGMVNTWDVPVSSGLLKPGFNELRVVTRQRSIEGLCRDIDNDANWVRLAKTSVLVISRKQQSSYALRCYPFPNLDYLANDGANALLALPPKPTAGEVQVMAELASNWGLREPFAKLPLRAGTHLPATGNAVVIGRYDRWSQFFSGGGPTAGGAEALKPTTGYLASSGGDEGVRLLVSGKDDDGMRRAALFLADPAAVDQLDTEAAVIPSDLSIKPVKPIVHKANRFTFTDLNAGKITLAGAFHQSTSVILPRPVRQMIGRESFVKIYFRHSATLNPRRSLLTVTVNGRKMGSIALTKDNILGGSLTVSLPVQELDADQWTIGLYAFHDLGTIDCSKRYDEVAWSVIEGHSFIELKPGKVPGYPTLANFPIVLTNTGKPVEPVTLWLPEKPSDAMLSAAAVVAARAGQANRVPLRWKVVMADTLPLTTRSRVVVMFAARNDEKRLNVVKNILPIWPSKTGFTVEKGLKVVPGSWNDPLILEAAETSWSKGGGVIYAVIGASDTAFSRLADKLTDPVVLQDLGAQIAVFTPKHEFAFTTIDPETRRRILDKEMDRYTWPMTTVVVLVVGVLLLLLLRLFLMMRRRPKKPAEADPGAPAGR
jgi:hypothetical protein